MDGTVRIDDAVDAAAQDSMPALALTDLCNEFGLIKFYKAARARGIKPIAGCDVLVTHEAEREAPCRQYPWDGVRNVRPFSRFGTTVVEGVY